MPESGSKFIASYGVATLLDPFLILLVDLLAGNFACQRYAACRENYTGSSCTCFNGDFIKLWYRMQRDEGSGITGLIITVCIYLATTVISALLLYEYLLHVHKDARIMDLWRRIDAAAEEFFCPHDFEISYNELLSIYEKAKHWRGAGGATRKLVVSEYLERDPYDPLFREVTKHYAIYEKDVGDGGGRGKLYRHFLLLPDGAIIEIFEEFSVDLTQQMKALTSLLGDQSIEEEGPHSHAHSAAQHGQHKHGNDDDGKAVRAKPGSAARKLQIFAGLNAL